MSIFGQLDAANIHTNAFYIEAGEYSATVTKAYYKKNVRDGEEQRQLVIEYTIDDEDSQYLDSKAYHYFNLVDPDMTAEKFALLPSEDQVKIRRSNSALKRTLCGDDNNSDKRGLGVPVDDVNDENWNPEVLVGTKVDMAISNYGANNEGVNIKWVNLTK